MITGAGSGGSLYRELYNEDEQRTSLESRLVKAADVVDLLVQVLALERAGARGLDESGRCWRMGFSTGRPGPRDLRRTFRGTSGGSPARFEALRRSK